MTKSAWQDNVTGAISAQSHVQLNYKSVINRYGGLTPGALSCMCHRALVQFKIKPHKIASAHWHIRARHSTCGTRSGRAVPFPSQHSGKRRRLGFSQVVSEANLDSCIRRDSPADTAATPAALRQATFAASCQPWAVA